MCEVERFRTAAFVVWGFFFCINERTPWSWGLAGQGFVEGNY